MYTHLPKALITGGQVNCDDPASAKTASTVMASGSTSSAGLTRAQILMVLLGLLGVGAAFSPTFSQLLEVWNQNPNYSHGFMVPLFACGLAWVAYTRHNVTPVTAEVSTRDALVGSIEVGLGLALHLFAMFLGRPALLLDAVALIFVLLGALMIAGGVRANRAYALPVLFLIFMAPLPWPVYQPIALALQNLASIVAVGLFDVAGIAAVRSGTIIDIPGPHDMEVGAACSGLRSLTAILALAVGIAYLSGRDMRYRTLLVLMAAPTAIAVNCLRVFGTGLIMIHVGPQWATGDAHKYEGLFMVGVAALMLALIAWVMAGMSDWRRETAAEHKDLRAPAHPA